MADAATLGNQIGGFLGGIFSPVAQIGKDLAGTTKTTETTGQAESDAASKRTATIVISILGVITLVIVGYYLLKNKSAA